MRRRSKLGNPVSCWLTLSPASSVSPPIHDPPKSLFLGWCGPSNALAKNLEMYKYVEKGMDSVNGLLALKSYPGPRGFLSLQREYQATDKEAARENLWLLVYRGVH